MKYKICLLLLCFSALILFSSAIMESQNPQWKGTIEYEDGIKVIKNPNKPLYGEITLELEKDISIGNEEDGNYYFYRGFDFGVDEQENMYIYDRGNFRIQKFDKQGKYVRSIGRKGQGPGEFSDLFTSLFLASDCNLYARGRRKIQKFNGQGEFENSFPFETAISDFGVIGKDIIFGISSSYSLSGRLTEIALFNSDGKKIKTFASLFNPRAELGASVIFSHPYENRLYFCVFDKDLGIYGLSSEYKLFFVNSSGEIMFIIEKEEPVEKMTQEERNKPFDELIMVYKKQGKKILKSELEKISNLSEYKPFFRGIMSDDAGNIYVRKIESISTIEKEAHYDLFNKEGYFLYKVKMPLIRTLPTPRVIIENGFFYQGEHDSETGLDSLVRYKIKNWDQIKRGGL